MARFELKLPKMGESVAEATITNWLKEVGDTIEADEAVLEIATDKVDSEVPSEVSGTLVEKLFEKDDLVQVGQTIAIIEVSGGVAVDAPEESTTKAAEEIQQSMESAKQYTAAPLAPTKQDFSNSDKFFSPLVKNIAKEEGVSIAELESISGTGNEGRVTKNDILNYLESRKSASAKVSESAPTTAQVQTSKTEVQSETPKSEAPKTATAQKAAPVS